MNLEQTQRIVLDVHSNLENLRDFVKICAFDNKISEREAVEILRILKDNNERLLNAV